MHLTNSDVRALYWRRKAHNWQRAAIALLIGLVAAVASCTVKAAEMITICSHPITKPLFVGAEKEQDKKAEQYQEKENTRQLICEQIPFIEEVPYGVEGETPERHWRVFLFLSR